LRKYILLCFIFTNLIGCKDQEAIDAKLKALQERDESRQLNDQYKAELSQRDANINSLETQIKKLKSELKVISAENKELKLTPRYFYDQAISVYKASSSNEKDEEAIKAFEIVVERFPEDSLSKVSKKKIKEIRKRIKKRIRDLKRAQAKVRKLVKRCTSKSKAVEPTRKRHVAFNMFGRMNMNFAMIGMRKIDRLEAAAREAKEKARNLLKDTPDPDGELRKAVEKCDDY
jgi:hypothetical protein